jgi:hypothetical protein
MYLRFINSLIMADLLFVQVNTFYGPIAADGFKIFFVRGLYQVAKCIGAGALPLPAGHGRL